MPFTSKACDDLSKGRTAMIGTRYTWAMGLWVALGVLGIGGGRVTPTRL